MSKLSASTLVLWTFLVNSLLVSSAACPAPGTDSLGGHLDISIVDIKEARSQMEDKKNFKLTGVGGLGLNGF